MDRRVYKNRYQKLDLQTTKSGLLRQKEKGISLANLSPRLNTTFADIVI